jgi:hypothetical protein
VNDIRRVYLVTFHVCLKPVSLAEYNRQGYVTIAINRRSCLVCEFLRLGIGVMVRCHAL